ncbi:tripartite tricarboxylate transporter substrate binding protein [Bosea sp. SSUT16]|uniref:Tripartite tricarboxylate transporter substrate binding protein n=1 Tax=Bosea spartocytisi TaxID=2773451 RepID=A0A927E8W2_9HYPH|nr:tripartite tricarboxylate transporter substrate binding protein [Bosea spartocytisi]MBD3846392.1 tripartite tricarboxylate transporter substrate binding protein [Bosea spartocytisi]MCT4471938.1 tripartite tricarboxylate transporter substrate binding protein [Bosea spartocytisi]
MRTSILRMLAAGALAIGLTGTASAQEFPSRSLKFVVPFAAGSATDAVARILGEHVSKNLGKPVVIENLAGASGVIAAQNVARAEPDGHTVLITTNTTHGANQSLLKHVPYDAINSFEAVGKLGTITLALATNPAVPAKTVQEFVAYAKANPGKLTFGAGSSSSRIAGEMLKSLAGLDITYVPYRSNPQAITDLLGGQINIVFADISTTLPQIKAGAVNGLAVSTARRSVLAPDLPTMAEGGVKGYDLAAWFAAFVPARTPRSTVDTLNRALTAAVNDPATKERLLAAGVEPETSTPDELKAFVGTEIAKWAEIVKAAGIQPE